MRVTQNMLSNNMLKNLSNSYAEMNKYMEQLSSGQKVNKPSDDPVVAVNAMGYRSELNEVQQYQRNIGKAHTWFDTTDQALNQTTQALQRVRELAVQASNGTNTEVELQNIQAEVEQLGEDLIDAVNTQVNDQYIFNGTDTTNEPIAEGELEDENGNIKSPSVNSGSIQIDVSAGTTLQMNVDANEVFDGLFKTINNFTTALENEDAEEINNSIDNIDDSLDKIISGRADLGARMNRLELVENRMAQQEVTATEMMAENENIDYTETIIQLLEQESVHRAALSTGAKIIQPTLVDFLQ